MAALHLILGVVGVVLGGFMILKRDWITANHQRRKGRAEVLAAPVSTRVVTGLRERSRERSARSHSYRM
jgi:hypothetical protein